MSAAGSTDTGLLKGGIWSLVRFDISRCFEVCGTFRRILFRLIAGKSINFFSWNAIFRVKGAIIRSTTFSVSLLGHVTVHSKAVRGIQSFFADYLQESYSVVIHKLEWWYSFEVPRNGTQDKSNHQTYQKEAAVTSTAHMLWLYFLSERWWSQKLRGRCSRWFENVDRVEHRNPSILKKSWTLVGRLANRDGSHVE